jgi:hypothetical protein
MVRDKKVSTARPLENTYGGMQSQEERRVGGKVERERTSRSR